MKYRQEIARDKDFNIIYIKIIGNQYSRIIKAPFCYVCDEQADTTCEKCGEPICSECGPSFTQFCQIDYDCCNNCADYVFMQQYEQTRI